MRFNLHWYATNGIPSLKTGKVKPFIGGGRRPKGETVKRVQRDVFYRVPLYKDSHAVPERDGDTSYCGRPMDVNPLWWVDSGWAEALGEWYLIEDTRKTGQCGPCRTAIKDRKARGEMPEPKVRPSPFTKPDEFKARLMARADRIRMNGLAAVVLRSFPGSEVVK